MTIENQIKILNEICEPFIVKPSKRYIRHHFFSNIKTEIQAYLLGFHAADGSLNSKRHTMAIKLTAADCEILELYKNFISPDAYERNLEGFKFTIRDKEVFAKKNKEIQIASKFISEDLIKFGFGDNKTYKELYLPKLEDENLLRHFVRGYFDGDGSFVGSVRKPNLKNREKNYRVSYSFQIDSKKSNIINELNEYFHKHNINTTINYVKRDDMYRVRCGAKNDITKLFHLLYDDSNFYLKRKFDKFNYYVNTEVSQIITDHCNA